MKEPDIIDVGLFLFSKCSPNTCDHNHKYKDKF